MTKPKLNPKKPPCKPFSRYFYHRRQQRMDSEPRPSTSRHGMAEMSSESGGSTYSPSSAFPGRQTHRSKLLKAHLDQVMSQIRGSGLDSSRRGHHLSVRRSNDSAVQNNRIPGGSRDRRRCSDDAHCSRHVQNSPRFTVNKGSSYRPDAEDPRFVKNPPILAPLKRNSYPPDDQDSRSVKDSPRLGVYNRSSYPPDAHSSRPGKTSPRLFMNNGNSYRPDAPNSSPIKLHWAVSQANSYLREAHSPAPRKTPRCVKNVAGGSRKQTPDNSGIADSQISSSESGEAPQNLVDEQAQGSTSDVVQTSVVAEAGGDGPETQPDTSTAPSEQQTGRKKRTHPRRCHYCERKFCSKSSLESHIEESGHALCRLKVDVRLTGERGLMRQLEALPPGPAGCHSLAFRLDSDHNALNVPSFTLLFIFFLMALILGFLVSDYWSEVKY